MTIALTIGAALAFLLIGAVFFWLNLNTPVQTRVPAFLLPLGVVLWVVAVTIKVLP